MAKKKPDVAKPDVAKPEVEEKEEKVNQGLFRRDSQNLMMIVTMSGDASIAATFKRLFRAQVEAHVMELMDRKKDELQEGA